MADEQKPSLGNPFHLLLFAVVIAGALGIVWVVAQTAGIVIPGFVVTIGWIVFCVVLAVAAIKFIAGLIGK